MIYRLATFEDASAILKLIKELAVFEKEELKDILVTEKKLIEYGFSENSLFQCFVAQEQETIVGIALFYPRFSTWKGLTIHLEDLIVTENFKNKGIGSKLFDLVLDYSKEKKAKRVEWEVLDWNENAIKFYKKKGATILKDWYLCKIHL